MLVKPNLFDEKVDGILGSYYNYLEEVEAGNPVVVYKLCDNNKTFIAIGFVVDEISMKTMTPTPHSKTFASHVHRSWEVTTMDKLNE